MALDVKILATNGTSLFGATWPGPNKVAGEYALAQRIVKNLLTRPGDDHFDDEWGAGLEDEMRDIAGQEQDKANRAASAAIRKCLQDLKSSQPDDPAGRIVALRLRSVSYDPMSTSWLLEVGVETEVNQFTLSTGV